MKTGKFFWMLLILSFGALTVFAQGRGFVNRPGFGVGAGYGYGPGFGVGAGYGYGPGYYCMNFISGMTEEQQSKIAELTVSHQKTMAELAIRQRSTFDFTERAGIQEQILQQITAHQGEVRNLLNDEQKKQYDLLRSRGMGYGAGYGMGYGMGRRGGRGGWGGRGCRFYGYGGGYGFN